MLGYIELVFQQRLLRAVMEDDGKWTCPEDEMVAAELNFDFPPEKWMGWIFAINNAAKDWNGTAFIPEDEGDYESMP